jgi:uncharacterized protein (TIGR02421 family)
MTTATRNVADAVRAALRRGDAPIRLTFGERGRVHLDRPLPFLCVHRLPSGAPDDLARHLIEAEAAYVVAPAGGAAADEAARVTAAIVEEIAPRFGAFLIVEVWTAPTNAARGPGHESPGDERRGGERAGVRRPMFRVSSESLDADAGTIVTLCRELEAIPLRPSRLEVEVVAAPPHPPDRPPLLESPAAATYNAHAIGIAVQPVYRQARTHRPYPVLLRTVAHGMLGALRRTFYHFQQAHTTLDAPHYQSLGRRSALDAVWDADRRLAGVVAEFDFLLKVTPLNTARARAAFERAGWRGEPTFDYRPLAVDVAALKRTLHGIRTDRLEDPTLAYLLDETRDEIDRKLTMLTDRDTPRFLHGSLQVYGEVDDALVGTARAVLDALPADRAAGDGARLDADAFAGRARAMLARYRSRDATLAAVVEIRGDVTGLMVSRGDLLIGRDVGIPAGRVDALLHHEIGTHVLTAHNGRAQPLTLLATGLAGYEETQEGLAVVAEYLAGGLTAARLRLLAARVIAARGVAGRAAFDDTFRELAGTHGFSNHAAFTIAMRVHRSGGFTKDAIYLRGLIAVLRHLGGGGDLTPLLVGKIRLSHIPAVEELLWRDLLRAPRLTPEYLTDPMTENRLRTLRDGRDVIDIAQELAT